MNKLISKDLKSYVEEMFLRPFFTYTPLFLTAKRSLYSSDSVASSSISLVTILTFLCFIIENDSK